MDRPIIVITLEGLATSALSCYGSSWNSTPAIDAIAASGCVWDRWMITRDDPVGVFEQWVSSRPWDNSGHLSRTLVTDDSRLIDRGIETHFDRCHLVDQVNHENPVDEDAIEQSQFGRLIESAMRLVEEEGITWIHSRFLTQRWDAPRAADGDEEYLDEEDFPTEDEEEDDGEIPFPPVFESVEPPEIETPQESHPDFVSVWMRTYGCQIRLVDLLTEVLLQSISELDPIVIIASTSGFALGQHGFIGHRIGPLRNCEMRLPMIVSGTGPIRCPQVTSSQEFGSIFQLLLRGDEPLIDPAKWCESAEEFTSPVIVESNRAEIAVTTHGWSMVRDDNGSEHLYLKPDDIEDANDVSRLEPNIVSELEQIASR